MSIRYKVLCPKCRSALIDSRRSKRCKRCYLKEKQESATGKRRGYGKWVPCPNCAGKNMKRERSRMCVACTQIYRVQKKRKYRYAAHAPGGYTCLVCGIELTDDNWPRGDRRHGRRICVICSRERGRQYARNAKEKTITKYARLKREVMDAYGGKCQCCGIKNIEFLSIDHINGNGRIHRKNLKRRIWGSSFYNWLKKNGFPKDNFQCLCMNCNWAKSHGGCPHQQKKRVKVGKASGVKATRSER